MRTALVLALFGGVAAPASAATLTGPAAYGDWRTDAPGVVDALFGPGGLFAAHWGASDEDRRTLAAVTHQAGLPGSMERSRRHAGRLRPEHRLCSSRWVY